MFYLDTPLDKWLQKYPALKDEEPLCDCECPNIIPFRTKKSVGIICKTCNTGMWIRSTAEGNNALLEMLYEKS